MRDFSEAEANPLGVGEDLRQTNHAPSGMIFGWDIIDLAIFYLYHKCAKIDRR